MDLQMYGYMDDGYMPSIGVPWFCVLIPNKDGWLAGVCTSTSIFVWLRQVFLTLGSVDSKASLLGIIFASLVYPWAPFW